MTAGKIKLLVIIIVLILSIVFPIGGAQPIKNCFPTFIFAFIFGVVFPQVPYANTLFEKVIFRNPKWSDKIDLKYPLSYIQFLAFLLIAAGIGSIIGGIFKGQFFNYIGMVFLSLAISSIIGIYLIPKILNAKK